jgi:hypothetical protein
MPPRGPKKQPAGSAADEEIRNRAE